jgi:hypothetical protein
VSFGHKSVYERTGLPQKKKPHNLENREFGGYATIGSIRSKGEKDNMIFRNIDFHNVEEMEKCEKGYILWRIPSSVRKRINEGAGKLASRYSTGVELRFRMTGDSAAVILRTDKMEEAQVAYIYYGSIQGGWQYSSKVILDQDTRITVIRPQNLELLKRITSEQRLGFQPELIRVVLPYGTCYFVGVEGEIEPPAKGDAPAKTYLAYGSSITHGSLALAAPYTYPFRIAQKFQCDYLNLGFAGSAQMEKAMAEYIVSRKDWDFASVEMGINMLKEEFSVELFDERVKAFVEILSRDSRPIFATNIFQINGADQEKAVRYREIVRKHAGEKLIFTDGLELLNNPAYISQDSAHPTLEGIAEITDRWYEVMRRHLLKPEEY